MLSRERQGQGDVDRRTGIKILRWWWWLALGHIGPPGESVMQVRSIERSVREASKSRPGGTHTHAHTTTRRFLLATHALPHRSEGARTNETNFPSLRACIPWCIPPGGTSRAPSGHGQPSPEPHRVLTKVTNAAPRSPFGGDERS